MKLFKRLLVAPAAIGLIAPISASASEVNLNEIANYSDVESIEYSNSFNDDSNINPLLAGGEGLVDSHSHDGGFSETTSAAFTATMAIGAETDDDAGDDTDDVVTAGYSFQIDLETSFTGEDLLAVSIDAGNANTTGIAQFDANSNGDGLDVDGLSYTFGLGNSTTVMFGDNMDASSLFTSACVYGGPGMTLSDCGVPNAGVGNGGAMAGIEYDFGTGFTAAFGYAGNEATLMTEEGDDAWGLNVAYTGDNYGLSATYGLNESDNAARVIDGYEDTYIGLQAYYTPEGNLPSVSVGYETGEDGSLLGVNDSLTSYFIGLTWDEVGPGSAGIAFGTKTPTVEDTDDQHMYEAYYSYPINDGMTITPLVYVQEVSADGVDDTTGIMVQTTFAF